MIGHVLDLLECPHCRSQLDPDGRAVRCGHGHTFDLGRPGYLNLSGDSAPRNADTADMVAARDRVLGSGRFDAVSAGLAGLAGEARAESVLDCGAGTGHYLAAVLEAVPAARGVALDVSVPAVRRAARAHPRIGAVVADAWRRLPIRDGVLDLVLSVFAPRNAAEFARVLRPGGAVVTVTPRPEHLAEIRGPLGLLAVEPSKVQRLADRLGSGFVPATSVELVSTTGWDHAELADLVAMGPNAFHTDLETLRVGVGRLPSPVPVTLAVDVGTWVRR